MKRTASSGSAARTLGKIILAAVLVFAAVAAGFGGTAFLVYQQLGGSHASSGKQAKAAARPGATERREARGPARPQTDTPGDAENRSQVRPVAATSTDRSAYTYADNRFGATNAPRGQDRTGAPGSRTTTLIPAPLASPAPVSDAADAPSREPVLGDPESRFIVDSRTGRIIGIDGSAGAAAETRRQEALQQRAAVPVATAVVPARTTPPEVRVATPVIVKRALPVTAEPADTTFNAADELAQDDTSLPVLRAQTVLPPGSRYVKTVRVYRLPDGSQTVVRD